MPADKLFLTMAYSIRLVVVLIAAFVLGTINLQRYAGAQPTVSERLYLVEKSSETALDAIKEIRTELARQAAADAARDISFTELKTTLYTGLAIIGALFTIEGVVRFRVKVTGSGQGPAQKQ